MQRKKRAPKCADARAAYDGNVPTSTQAPGFIVGSGVGGQGRDAQGSKDVTTPADRAPQNEDKRKPRKPKNPTAVWVAEQHHGGAATKGRPAGTKTLVMYHDAYMADHAWRVECARTVAKHRDLGNASQAGLQRRMRRDRCSYGVFRDVPPTLTGVPRDAIDAALCDLRGASPLDPRSKRLTRRMLIKIWKEWGHLFPRAPKDPK